MAWRLRVLLWVALGSVLAAAQQANITGRVKLVYPASHFVDTHADSVVVWLTPASGQAKPAPTARRPLTLTQRNKHFEPHLLVVPVGAVVEFPNRDPFFHNVFSLYEGKRFDLGLYEAGSTRNVSFDRPGISYIFCNIHAEMSAVVIALETPYYGISGRRGEVTIPDVPLGRYIMRAWSERALPEALDRVAREVSLTEESPSLGLIEIASEPVRAAHSNKYGMDYEPPLPQTPGYKQP